MLWVRYLASNLVKKLFLTCFKWQKAVFSLISYKGTESYCKAASTFNLRMIESHFLYFQDHGFKKTSIHMIVLFSGGEL